MRALKKRRREKTSFVAFSSLLKRTLKSYKEIIDYEQYLLNNSKEMCMLNDFRLTLKRYIKENIAIVYFREIVKIDLNNVQFSQMTKRKRVSLADVVAAKSNVVIVDMIRAKKQKRIENDVEKAKQTMKIATARLLKKQLKKKKQVEQLKKQLFRELKRAVIDRMKRLNQKEKLYTIQNRIYRK